MTRREVGSLCCNGVVFCLALFILLVYPEDKAIEALPRIREIHKEWRDYLTEELTAQERELAEVIVEKLALRAARYQNERGGEQRQ